MVVACGGDGDGDASCDVEVAGGTIATSVEGKEASLVLQRPGHEDREVGGFTASGSGGAFIYPRIDPDRSTVLIFSDAASQDYFVRGDDGEVQAERADGCSLPGDRLLYVADGDPGSNPVVDRSDPPSGFTPGELEHDTVTGYMGS
jgi:hypothetical protein